MVSAEGGASLRPYQRRALDGIREAYRAGHRRALVVMPTGTGKTVLFAEVARLAKGPVLVVAHREELIDQARDKISLWCDDVVAVEMADRRGLTRPGTERPKIAVASIQSLSRRLAGIPRDAFRIVVVDEAHHATAPTYRRVLEHFDAHVLGVTATPDRGDRARLGDVFDAVAFEYDMVSAIDDGWLCPVRSFLVQTQADFSQVRKVAGELAAGEVEDILTQDKHLIEIAEPILRERGERPAMVFAASVAHAHALSRVLCEKAGDARFAAALDGGSDSALRRATIERFRRGELQVLVNCSLFTEGFDVPQVALVAVARPVLSRSFYAQMVGRGTRIAPGKQDVLVLDFVPANCRHSLVQSVDIFATGDDEVKAEARRIAAERSAEGEAMALEQVMELARQVVEARQASVEYRLVQRDPFAAAGFDVDGLIRQRRGAPADSDQQRYLVRAGLPADQAARLGAQEADELMERLRDRKAVGLCSPKQARQLAQLGIDGENVYQDEARAILAFAKKNKHRPPHEIREAWQSHTE